MTDQYRLPWDPLWEYVFSEYEDDEGDDSKGDDSTVPTVETALSSLPERKQRTAAFPKTVKTKSRNKSSTKASSDSREDSASIRHPWRRRQVRDVDDDDAQASMWDLLGPDFDPGEKARHDKVSNKKSTRSLIRNKNSLLQKMKPSQAKGSSDKRNQSAKTNKVKRSENASKTVGGGTREKAVGGGTREKAASQQKWDDPDFAPLIMVFDVMERFERFDPLGLNKTFSSKSQSSDSSAESEQYRFKRLNPRRRVSGKKANLRPTFSSGKNPTRQEERATKEDIARSSGHNRKSLLNYGTEEPKSGLNRRDDPNGDFNETKSCLNGKDFLRISFPEKSPNENQSRPRVNHGPPPNTQDHPHNLTQKLACFNKMDDDSIDFVHQLNDKDLLHFFPAARMVSNSNIQTPIGEEVDFVNGVMGIPSDKFLETKGPQSLYAYDYSSNEHMDVSYSTYSEDPIASLVVRSLGPVPSLLPDAGKKVIIQVEASTVSATDCDIRRGNWRSQQDDPLPITPGVDIAGKVYGVSQKVTSQFNLFPGQTVVSLVKWGGNSRFVSLSPEQLVRVPDGIDPAQATCLAETYLSAFQMLHHGQKGSRRYVEKSLSGKSVLIVGLMTNSFGKAIMELALNAGAAIVFATAKKKHWKMLIELGIIPLGLDPSEWVERVQGTVDLVLAPMGELVGEDLTAVYHRTLRDTGHLIMYGRRHSGDDISVGHRAHKQPSLVCKPIKASLNLKDRTHSYDVYEQWDQNLEICKKDLMHLLGMLERGIIKPRVLDRIPLSKVAQAQRLIESRRRISGFLVCEPWMKKKKRALYL